MRVLVTDGEQRAALAIVRSLGSADHEVWVAAADGRSLAGSSRYASGAISVPDPLSRPAHFGDVLLTEATLRGIDAVVPVTDASLRAAFEVRSELEKEGILFPFATSDAHRAISDKARALREAEQLNIGVPKQVTVPTKDALANADLRELRYPVVLKPARSVVEVGDRRQKVSVAYAADEGALRAELQRLLPEAFPVLLQERIEGPGVGVFLLRWQGQTMAVFCHRRIREKPPSGGVSVLRESVEPSATLIRQSESLLDSFSWVGPAMVEYKLDQSSGKAYLMEVNGRYWGSLQLAIDSGVDFPAIHLDVAAGRPRSPTIEYEIGVRTRWLLGDMDHLIARLRPSDANPESVASAQGGRLSALVGFISAFRPGIRNEVFRWTDPVPAAIEAAHWVRDSIVRH